MIILPRN